MRVTMLFVVPLFAFGIVACGKTAAPKAGEPCEIGPKGMPTCADASNAIYCHPLEKKWTQIPCKGPKGCTAPQSATAAGEMQCDFSGNAAGEACSLLDNGQAMCAADKKSKVACRDSKIVLEKCPGAKGCYIDGIMLRCDE